MNFRSRNLHKLRMKLWALQGLNPIRMAKAKQRNTAMRKREDAAKKRGKA